jgi:uncharacterized repeat protein (TIGR01451 family)
MPLANLANAGGAGGFETDEKGRVMRGVGLAWLLLLVGFLAGWTAGWRLPFSQAQERGAVARAPGVQLAFQEGSDLRPSSVSDPPTPCVQIRVRVPAQAEPGKELTYRITVENRSRAEAHHVLVRQDLPKTARYVRATPEPVSALVPAPQRGPQTPSHTLGASPTGGTDARDDAAQKRELRWEFGTMSGCSRKEIVLVVVPTGEGDLTSCARVRYEYGQCVRTRLGSPTLQVRLTGPEAAALFDAVTFQMEVSNQGDAPARNVVVTSRLPEGMTFLNSKPSTRGDNPLTWNLGTLTPGQTRRIECHVSVMKNGTLTNEVAVTAAGGVRREAQHAVRVSEPRLEVFHTGPAARLVGRSARYQVTVVNPGTVPVRKVRIVYPLYRNKEVRAALDFVQGSSGKLVDPDVIWEIDEIRAGEKRTVALEVRARQAGQFGNVVTVSADRIAEAKAKGPPTRFEMGAGLTAEIAKSQDPVEVGEAWTFTVRALNAGKSDLSRVGVKVTVPEGLEVVAPRGPTAARQQGKMIVFAPLPTLKVGTVAEFNVRLRAAQAGEVTLPVELTSAEAGTPIKAEETVTIISEVRGQQVRSQTGGVYCPF